jgi:hypoxanthine-DNA glycosylase
LPQSVKIDEITYYRPKKISVLEIQGFPPIADNRAKVLVLGSMPSEISLSKQQSYAHPRNAFWPVMGELFAAYPELAYAERKKILLQNGVAVWDVLASCRREGSADSDIIRDSIQTNDFATFFQHHVAIKRVFFNGGTAEALYKKYVLPVLDGKFSVLRYQRLPSTSPAFAGMSRQQKIDAWRVILPDSG